MKAFKWDTPERYLLRIFLNELLEKTQSKKVRMNLTEVYNHHQFLSFSWMNMTLLYVKCV